MGITTVRQRQFAARLLGLGMLLVHHLEAAHAMAEDQWQLPVTRSADRCDSTPKDAPHCTPVPDPNKQSPAPMQPLFELPVLQGPDSLIEPPTTISRLPIPLTEPPASDSTPAIDDLSGQRLNRLRDLFGQLHDRLDVPLSHGSPVSVPSVTVADPLPVEDSAGGASQLTPPLPTEVTVAEQEPPLPETIEPEPEPEPEAEPSVVTAPASAPVQPMLLMLDRIDDSSVNRLELADNLFAAGELQMALDAYAAITLEGVTEHDQQWIILQTAACYRQLNDVSEAAKRYRQLVNVVDPAWVGDTARWWLKSLETRNAISQQTRELDTIIEQWKEAVSDDIGSRNGSL